MRCKNQRLRRYGTGAKSRTEPIGKDINRCAFRAFNNVGIERQRDVRCCLRGQPLAEHRRQRRSRKRLLFPPSALVYRPVAEAFAELLHPATS
jgi:hypothetical protein